MGWTGRATALAALILTAGPAAAQTIPAGSTYVALGSSFAAGPGVTREADDALPRCSQSQDNYARQLARMRRLKLVDRSCGGATTVHVLQGGQFGQPAQIDALTPDTRLVTVTIGGNDWGYMAALGAMACKERPEAVPDSARRICAQAILPDTERMLETAGRNLRQIGTEVRRRSPKARLVFVDYVTILPDRGACPNLPLKPEEVGRLQPLVARLAALTEAAARASGADLVKASALTRGHDLCAADPWVQGFVFRPAGASWGPTAFHPTLAAHTAIARALDTTLGR
jgi:lysophospholipase L1-like esterase